MQAARGRCECRRVWVEQGEREAKEAVAQKLNPKGS